jgi:hypothetical protein
MSFSSKWCVLLLSIVSALGADKEKPFEPQPMESYANRQTVEELTIAAEPFSDAAKTRAAFGKLNPNQHGILPVFVVMKNGGDKTLSLESIKVEYISPSRERVEATPARDVARSRGSGQPRLSPNPLPIPTSPRSSLKKNPLNAWEIEGRAFAARMLSAGETASGFFYFQAPYRTGSILYITGVQEAATHRELFFFEIPLER